jgi:hypothetical protein
VVKLHVEPGHITEYFGIWHLKYLVPTMLIVENQY